MLERQRPVAVPATAKRGAAKRGAAKRGGLPFRLAVGGTPT